MDDQRTDEPARVQQHQQYTNIPTPAPSPEPEPESPVGADVPNMRALGRAEQDLSLYAAIIGHRPALGPAPTEEDAADEAQAKRFQLSLHLNLPTRLHMPSLPSLNGWRQKQASV